MVNVPVLIGGELQREEQAERILRGAVLMHQRAGKFLKDYAHWSDEKRQTYLDDYLGAAEIIHAFIGGYAFDHVVFINNRAQLNGTLEEVFGRTPRHPKQE